MDESVDLWRPNEIPKSQRGKLVSATKAEHRWLTSDGRKPRMARPSEYATDIGRS